MSTKAPKRLFHVALFLVALATVVLFSLPANAQTDQGRIAGTVTDANGALVPAPQSL